MANNSSNIKKTLNNHPSSEVTEHKKNPQHIILKIQVLVWDRHKHVEEFNQIMRSEPSPLISLVLLIMSLKFLLGAILVVIIWQLDLQLPMQSVPIITNVVSSNHVHGEVYSIQHYVIKFFSNLLQVSGFLYY